MGKRVHPRKEFLKSVMCEQGVSMRRSKAVDADVLNISTGGVCIMTERACRQGKLVRLWLPIQDMVIQVPTLAKVRWVAPVDGRFKIGLQFLT
jgi:Tfp pilus assembly protein PilZ